MRLTNSRAERLFEANFNKLTTESWMERSNDLLSNKLGGFLLFTMIIAKKEAKRIIRLCATLKENKAITPKHRLAKKIAEANLDGLQIAYEEMRGRRQAREMKEQVPNKVLGLDPDDSYLG